MADYDFARLLGEVKKEEGFHRQVYKDSLGYWTLGYGFLVDPRRREGIPEDVIEIPPFLCYTRIHPQLGIGLCPANQRRPTMRLEMKKWDDDPRDYLKEAMASIDARAPDRESETYQREFPYLLTKYCDEADIVLSQEGDTFVLDATLSPLQYYSGNAATRRLPPVLK